MIDSTLFWRVLSRSSTVNQLHSLLHGPDHWARVWENAQLLMSGIDDPYDRRVIDAFCLLHDSERTCDEADPAHGERGFRLGRRLGLAQLLDSEALQTLEVACKYHDQG